jgi:large subunit ribosomal protein L19
MNIIDKIEKAEIEKLVAGKKSPIPEFSPGDTVKVGVKIVEGKTERLQYFQGLCIARSNDSINSSFTVRKISGNEGVERKFPLYSPRVESIEVLKKGIVKRAKLYYMRNLRGKAARIEEKKDFFIKKDKKSVKAEAKKEVKAEAKTETKKTETPKDKK